MPTIFDYGVKGDGETVDSSGLQAWLDACAQRDAMDPMEPAMLPARGDPFAAWAPQGFKAKYRLDRPLLVKWGGFTLGTPCRGGAQLVGPSQFPLVHVAPVDSGPPLVPSLVPGPGRACRFGGWINLRDLATAAEIDGLGALTVECFLRLDADIGDLCAVVASSGQLYYGAPITSAFALAFLNRDNRPRFTLRTTSGTHLAASRVPLEPGRVHHVAAVYDGAEVRLYVDGVQAAATPATGAIVQEPEEDVTVGSQMGAFPDVNGIMGGPVGAFDSLRLSAAARYVEAFPAPTAKHALAPHDGTLVLLNCDGTHGPFVRAAAQFPHDGGTGCWVEYRGRPIAGPVPAVTITNLGMMGGSCGVSARRAVSLTLQDLNFWYGWRAVSLRDNSFMSAVLGCKIQYPTRGGIWIAAASGLSRVERCDVNGSTFPLVFSDNQMSCVARNMYLGAGAPRVGVLAKDANEGMVVNLDDVQFNDELLDPKSNRFVAPLVASGLNSLSARGVALYTCTRAYGLANQLPAVVLDGGRAHAFQGCPLEPDKTAPAQVKVVRPPRLPATFAGHRDPSTHGVPLAAPDQRDRVARVP